MSNAFICLEFWLPLSAIIQYLATIPVQNAWLLKWSEVDGFVPSIVSIHGDVKKQHVKVKSNLKCSKL